MKRGRKASAERKTFETEIKATLTLDGSGKAQIETGLGFLDHLLESFSRHSSFDISLSCRGDTVVDDHHTAEDCALVLGSLVDTVLAGREGIKRFGSALVPMDEALARVAVDLSGRAYCFSELMLKREKIGDLSCENIPHFFRSFASASRSTIHVEVLRGENDHHKAEASFKALALALKEAVSLSGEKTIRSTKGSL